MPSGKVHDAVTFALAVPAVGIAYIVTENLSVTVTGAAAFLFGGLMFGPDLDTVSRPYARWGPARAIWLPYRYFFPHRSRFSHGLLFGAFFRVIYFLGVVSILALLGAYMYQAFAGGALPGAEQVAGFWRPTGAAVRQHFGENILIVFFVGLWAGAASHTFTDMAGSFIKTGRSGKFF